MTWKSLFTSSIGKKFIMGLTGLFLIGFLIIHCSINAMIFFNDGGQTFNHWGNFMSTNLIVRTLEIGLFAGFLLHIVQGFVLWSENRKARPVQYNQNGANTNSNWYSRSMGLLGTLILLFLILHIYHFWVPSRFGGLAGIKGLEQTVLSAYNDQPVHNLYLEMKNIFTGNLPVVLIYIAGVISLGWHLLHGFQSAFQTFGLNHKRYTPIIQTLGTAFSVIISLVFALMPIAFYLHWVD